MPRAKVQSAFSWSKDKIREMNMLKVVRMRSWSGPVEIISRPSHCLRLGGIGKRDMKDRSEGLVGAADSVVIF